MNISSFLCLSNQIKVIHLPSRLRKTFKLFERLVGLIECVILLYRGYFFALNWPPRKNKNLFLKTLVGIK